MYDIVLIKHNYLKQTHIEKFDGTRPYYTQCTIKNLEAPHKSLDDE